MCAVSMITDHYRDKWAPMWPETSPLVPMMEPPSFRYITQKEWEEYQELKRKAVAYDNETGQPNCEKPHIDWEEFVKNYFVETDAQGLKI